MQSSKVDMKHLPWSLEVDNSEFLESYQDIFKLIIWVSSEKMVILGPSKQKLEPQTYIDVLYGNI